MDYQLNLGAWNSIFAVPSVVVDRHLKLAGALQLKVLLWILRNNGTPFDITHLSAATGASEADVRDALVYWTETGILSLNENGALQPGKIAVPGNDFIPADIALPTAVVTPAAKTEPKHTIGKIRHPKPDPVYIATRINDSENIRFLMEEAQTIIGSVLSPAMSSLLLYICDDIGIPPEVILMLLHYAKSIGKTSTSYIESVARDWAENNVFTIEAADEKLKQLKDSAGAWRKVENAVEISHRSPSKRELNYASVWVCEWRFTEDMLRLAYEICVNSIQKLDFKYMDSILRRWHDNGIATTAQASEDQQKQKASRMKPTELGTTYDIDDFEKMNLLKLNG